MMRCYWCAWGLLMVSACAEPNNQGVEEAPPAEPVPVETVTLVAGDLHPTLSLLGSLAPRPEHVAVASARVTSQVAQVLVVPGQRVEKNAVIARLDAKLLAAELARAEASVAERTAAHARLETGSRPQEIEAARQRVKQRQAVTTSLRGKLGALEELARRQEISPVRIVDARAAVREAEAAEAAARADAGLVEAGPRKETIVAAAAQLDLARAELAIAKLRLEYCTVVAPIAGTVTRVFVSQGSNTQPTTAIVEIANFSDLFARVRVPAAVRPRLRVGASAIVYLAGVATHQGIAGSLVRIAPQAGAATSAVDASVRVDNVAGKLVPGLACRVVLLLPVLENVVIVPADAVAERSGESVVTLVRAGQAHEVRVRLGSRGRQGVQVLAGLAAGDVVITEGGYDLPEGCPVRVNR